MLDRLPTLHYVAVPLRLIDVRQSLLLYRTFLSTWQKKPSPSARVQLQITTEDFTVSSRLDAIEHHEFCRQLMLVGYAGAEPISANTAEPQSRW
jgi:hypothetical protein